MIPNDLRFKVKFKILTETKTKSYLGFYGIYALSNLFSLHIHTLFSDLEIIKENTYKEHIQGNINYFWITS